jgi:hypothetical protein
MTKTNYTVEFEGPDGSSKRIEGPQGELWYSPDADLLLRYYGVYLPLAVLGAKSFSVVALDMDSDLSNARDITKTLASRDI